MFRSSVEEANTYAPAHSRILKEVCYLKQNSDTLTEVVSR